MEIMGLVNKIFLILGFFFLLLGIIGIFLPLLPTTPFGLLAFYFFSRGSPRIAQWCLGLPGIG